jgi:integrase
VQPTSGGTLVGPLKNKSAYRTVPAGRVVIDAAAAHLKAYPAGPEDFVFRRQDGSALSRDFFNPNVWHGIRDRAGLPAVGMHDLRHFYASALIRANLNVKVVSARLGHANAAMTLNTYSHLWPDDEDRTRQAIDDLLGADVPHLRPTGEA